MNKSYRTAAFIVVGIVLVLVSGVIFPSEENEAATNATQETVSTMSVTVINANSQPYVKDIVLRGHTESLRSVSLKSQLKGRIVELPVEKGMRVAKGDVICRIDVEDREASNAEAVAIVQQRELEHKASAELFRKGHRSETQHSSAKAALDSAIARSSRAKVNLDNTQIRAPFDGVINDRLIEVGDYMKEGEVCALIMEENPFLVVADISENQISQAKIGQEAHAILQGGRRLDGKIRYVSSIADKSTRTFRVELEVPNPNNDIRDGVTAELFLRGDEVPAQKISAATLVLEDNGLVGVRVVDQNNKVLFKETEILGNHDKGIWVTAISSEYKIITEGHEFVAAGETVNPVSSVN